MPSLKGKWSICLYMNNIYFTFVSDVFAEHSLSQCYHFAYIYIYIYGVVIING